MPDPELRAKLTPDYTLGCKRILPTNDWYPALTKPNVEVVTEGIREIKAGLDRHGRRRGAAGRHDHPRHRLPRDRHPGRAAPARQGRAAAVRGLARERAGLLRHRRGRLPQLLLPDRAQHRARAQLDGVHDRVADRVRARLRRARWTSTASRPVEVRPEVQAAFNEEVQARMPDTVWMTGGCSSWYLDPTGPQHHALAGLHLPLPAAHEQLRPAELRRPPRPGPKSPSRRADSSRHGRMSSARGMRPARRLAAARRARRRSVVAVVALGVASSSDGVSASASRCLAPHEDGRVAGPGQARAARAASGSRSRSSRHDARRCARRSPAGARTATRAAASRPRT